MNIEPSKIFVNDYNYDLPEDKIALYPLKERDSSKLLIYSDKGIEEKHFYDLPNHLDEDSLLILNDTKVIPARLIFKKDTGAEIEIFLLEETGQIKVKSQKSKVKNQKSKEEGKCEWKCLVGNLKKWKSGILYKTIEHKGEKIVVEARMKSQKSIPTSRDKNQNISQSYTENTQKYTEEKSIPKSRDKNQKENKDSIEQIMDTAPNGEMIIEFNWKPEHIMFSEILETAGLVPLPPYIKRQAEEEDKKTYQTVYAKINGSVAAPTAGLHFTDRVLEKLKNKGIEIEYLTLHVNTGNFKPVTAATIDQHTMHKEYISVNKETINKIINHLSQKSKVKSQKSKIKDKEIVAVGTTSCRTLESLYWFGVKLKSKVKSQKSKNEELDFDIGQWEPYEMSSKSKVQSSKFNFNKDAENSDIEPVEAFKAIKEYMDRNHLEVLCGATSLLIVPGYKFRVVSKLITNFHQPKSTLLLLIAALMGDKWKEVYKYALENEFRFLSYGDSCLIAVSSEE